MSLHEKEVSNFHAASRWTENIVVIRNATSRAEYLVYGNWPMVSALPLLDNSLAGAKSDYGHKAFNLV